MIQQEVTGDPPAPSTSTPKWSIPRDVLARRLDQDIAHKIPLAATFLIGLIAYGIGRNWTIFLAEGAVPLTLMWLGIGSGIAILIPLFAYRRLKLQHANATIVLATIALMTGIAINSYSEGTGDPAVGLAVIELGLASMIYRLDLALLCLAYASVLRWFVLFQNGLEWHPVEEFTGGIVLVGLVAWIIFWRRRIQVDAENFRWVDRQLNLELTRLVGQLSEEVVSRKATEAQLRQKQDELTALTDRVLSIQEEERGRIARELHDELGQVLTATGFSLASLRKEAPASLAGPIDESLNLVSESIRQIRSLATELRPSLLDHLGLESALQWTAERFRDRLDIPVEFESINGHDRFPMEVEAACFRVAQEALTNSLRHAKASKIRIVHENSPTHLCVRIEDDGEGFNVEETMRGLGVNTGLGLLGMRERAQSIHGTLSIRSVPRAGTSIELKVPRPGLLASA